MEFWASLFVFVASISAILAQYVQESELVINGTLPMSHTDANYICATIDWWPDDKCNYNHCPWGSSSALNLDLSHPILTKAVQAFEHLRIRVGGSLQDQVVYNVGDLSGLCHPFTKMKGGLFGFSKGCLRMDRWDELNHFFVNTRAIVTFGLNALPGRHQIKERVWEGRWNSSNARDFIKYTVSKGYQIHSWEFGNELSGKGIGAMVHAEQYASDLIELRGIIDNLYQEVPQKPLLVAPGGFFDKEWFAKLLKVSGSKVVDVMTLHLYNLGPGIDPNLVTKILDPHFLSRASITFNDLQQTIKANGPWASSWIGESGGAYNSGGLHVSDTFVNSFWYLDQLAMAAKYHVEVYCRQTLIGGNYGLLNKTTFLPNPDYYRSSFCRKEKCRTTFANLCPLFKRKSRYDNKTQTIDCNDQGAEFISAKSNIQLQDILVSEGVVNFIDEFLPSKIRVVVDDQLNTPLLATQVTTFECGGLALGVSVSHRLVDASTLCTFLNEWAVTNREENEIQSTGPGFISSSLFPARGLPPYTVPPMNDDKFTRKKISFSESVISSMKSNRKDSTCQWSKVQLVSAIIWKALMAVDHATYKCQRESILLQPINLREKMASVIPKDSCGNIWGYFATKAKTHETPEELTDLLCDSLKKAVSNFSKACHDSEEGQTMVLNCLIQLANVDLESTNVTGITSWCKFPFYEADFGFGKPTWVAPGTLPIQNSAFLMDYPEGNGIEAYVYLEVKDVPFFEEALNL